ncbi:MAG: cupredoxin family copper-binding protein [Acidobacteriota bacterium]
MTTCLSRRRLAFLIAALGLALSSLSLGAAKEADKPVTHTVTIDATNYEPPFIVVKPGDSIVWTNNDMFRHTVTAKAGGFDSKDIPAGGSWKYTPKTVGRFEYSCIYHTTMKGLIIVK